MREHPILMSAPMVQALRAGTKTQTRRIMKPQPEHLQVHIHNGISVYDGEHRMWCWKDLVLENLIDFPKGADRAALAARNPYGQVGDRLWVRETFMPWIHTSIEYPCEFEILDKEYLGGQTLTQYVQQYGHQNVEVAYRADGDDEGGWRPSIFMPRWASRITLTITEVRIQRLQEISYKDAVAEGCPETDTWQGSDDFPLNQYQALWESINGKGSWALNPWVWAVTFEVMKP